MDVFLIVHYAGRPAIYASADFLDAVKVAQGLADEDGLGSHYVIETWRGSDMNGTTHIYGNAA